VISGASYTTTATVGSRALSFDGSGDDFASESAVDLVGVGATDAMSVMGWVYPRNTDQRSPVGWWSDKNNALYAYNDGNGNWEFFVEVDGTGGTAVGSAITTDSWTHIYLELTQSDAVLKVDGNVDASISHGADITNLGAMKLRSGSGPFGNESNHILDDYHAANNTLSDGELQAVIDRGN